MSFTLALNLKQLQPSDLVLPLALICPWCLDQSKSEQVLTLSVMAAVCLQAYVVQRGDHPRLWLATLTLETIMLTYVPFFELKWWFGCTPLVGLRQSFDVSQAIPEVFIFTVCTSILGWNWTLNTRWLHRNAKAS
jgi:hypothetical protein